LVSAGGGGEEKPSGLAECRKKQKSPAVTMKKEKEKHPDRVEVSAVRHLGHAKGGTFLAPTENKKLENRWRYQGREGPLTSWARAEVSIQGETQLEKNELVLTRGRSSERG